MGSGGKKETIRIYLKLLATSTDRIHENVMKRNYNWFFSSPSTTTTTPGLRCNKRKKYEKWSCGMRWYLWRIIHMAAADASTMNSYKRIYVRSEMENFSLQLEIDCPSAHQEIFHLFPRNTSSSSFSCLSPSTVLASNKAQSLMRCNIYQLCDGKPHVSVRAGRDRARELWWLVVHENVLKN